jgi:hypothetical protein
MQHKYLKGKFTRTITYTSITEKFENFCIGLFQEISKKITFQYFHKAH